ncbi:hypothetical protein [Enterococcus wangshanyuanii]|uniref:Uncharacterized protein n=1 Tax=Enterococcus wangshanyuanii TaxID=2005703 RepID=A0ABQ1NSI4_9ENTE|nr:hypothetical protein [Enterococcus wangshanyuanii]GGC84347.1 hypothetical protein GCM10011573_12470 [Enterococcus wangshanyuanii]
MGATKNESTNEKNNLVFEQLKDKRQYIDIGKKKATKDKPLDDIQNKVLSDCSTYMLTNEEIAALLTSIMRNIMLQPHNETLLQDQGINRVDRNTQLVTEVQRVWTMSYLESLPHDNKS